MNPNRENQRPDTMQGMVASPYKYLLSMTQEHTSPLHAEVQIIIVEDDRDLRESMEEYFTLAGYRVSVASSAREFYQQLSLKKFALAILDIGLPDQEGFILAEYARKNTDMRIIILSGRSSAEDRFTGYSAGADIYMVKPVDCRELAVSVANLLSRIASVPPQSREQQLPSTDKKARPWRLDCSEWILRTPEETAISLSSKEFDFLFCLLRQPKKVVPRTEILKALAYQQDDYGNRALEAMVHRFRKKTETVGWGFPVKNSRGIGYCLTADMVIEHNPDILQNPDR